MGNVRPQPAKQKTEQEVVWCAIYTRKSSDENLNSDFTSLDAQREYASSFIKSREPMGWKVYPVEYSDPGISGGTMDRPALKRLLADAKLRKFQVVVCYKYDRLSRNTKDFLHILDIFDQHGVSFVSVTQPIDTTSSIGRLMRSILMDFAQFERELVSERTRDKMAAMVRKGRRAGGWPTLGYDIDQETKHLVVNEPEAKIVEDLFKIYAKSKSLSQTSHIAHQKGYTTKVWTTKDGKRRKGGQRFFKTSLQYVFRNPLYTGKIRHHGEIFPGVHTPIISEDLFNRVGNLLARNMEGRIQRTMKNENRHIFILKGLVKCANCDSAMSPTYNGKGICYYKCQRVMKLDKTACPTKAANADSLEEMIVGRLAYLAQHREVVDLMLEKAMAHSSDQLPTKREEKISLIANVDKVESELRNIAHILAQEGVQSSKYRYLMDTMSELEERRSAINQKIIDTDLEIRELEGQRIEADVLRNNLSRFNEVFQMLKSEERQELVQLYVKGILYDGVNNKVRLELRALPDLTPMLDGVLAGTGEVSNSVQRDSPS